MSIYLLYCQKTFTSFGSLQKLRLPTKYGVPSGRIFDDVTGMEKSLVTKETKGTNAKEKCFVIATEYQYGLHANM